MMHDVRPWRIFNAVAEREASKRLVTMKLPLRRDPKHADYSLTSIEFLLLLAIQRILKARRIFEFGTWLGTTTYNLALNAPDANIWTFDLDGATAGIDKFWQELNGLRERIPLEFAGTPEAERVTILEGNSRTYDFDSFDGQIDLVLCDGDREYPAAIRDTETAFYMVGSRQPAAIVWHDYQNPAIPEHTAFLDRLSRHKQLIHPVETNLAIWTNAPALAEIC